jgi:hypothetical protein
MSINDDDLIDLRKVKEELSDEPEFEISQVSHEENKGADLPNVPAENSSEKIRVRFDKFVNLVASHSYEDIFEKHEDEEIIVSTNLLADLANAHEEKDEGKKTPLFFIFGIVLGIAIAWIIFKY